MTAAEQLLQSLGVTKPDEIDLEAIAWTLGVRVKYQPLDGCEACITGDMERAIVTVNARGSRRRRRYSLGHELGHWKYDRGKILVCRAEEAGSGGRKQSPEERVADGYAADLLLPGYLFRPIARSHPKLNFKTAQAIADIFDTSITSTAIRLVSFGHTPAILVCHGQNGRKWFSRGPDVPEHWFPQDLLARESSAFDILFGNRPNDTAPHKVTADDWFDRHGASRYEIEEQTMRIGDEALTLLLIRDDDMLEEREQAAGRRRCT